jgi:hypothetical protein
MSSLAPSAVWRQALNATPTLVINIKLSKARAMVVRIVGSYVVATRETTSYRERFLTPNAGRSLRPSVQMSQFRRQRERAGEAVDVELRLTLGDALASRGVAAESPTICCDRGHKIFLSGERNHG